MHKEIKVHNTGNGVNVHADVDDDIGSMDFKLNIKLKNKDDIPAVQAAWAEAASTFEATGDVPSAIRETALKLMEHVADMEQKVKGSGGE